MTKAFIGTKIVGAYPSPKVNEVSGVSEPGYAIEYEDGYLSWCPKDTFERSYRPVTTAEADLVLKFGTQE